MDCCIIANILSRIDFTALAPVVMAIFTGCLVVCNILLWRSNEKSVKLAREEFVANHPPKLRVHSVSLFKNLEVGKKWEIRFFINNIGVSTATIKNSSMTCKPFDDPLPVPLPFDNESKMLNGKTIVGDGRIKESYILDEQTAKALNLALWNGVNKTDARTYYFFGYINYVDSNNIRNIKQIVFCRRFNIETERFTAVEEENYE